MTPLVANARMYAVTPAVEALWRELLLAIGNAARVPLVYVEHAAPAPLDALWARGDLGLTFMCGWPFANQYSSHQAIAAPIPAAVIPGLAASENPEPTTGLRSSSVSSGFGLRPPRNDRRGGSAAVYWTDLTVVGEGGPATLEDALNGLVGWTAEHSQSGFHAVRAHVAGMADAPRPEWVGPLVTPRRVIEALLSGAIEVGPLDSYWHALLRRHEPETAGRLRVVGATRPTPMPLLVASPDANPELIEALRRAAVDAASDPELRPLLGRLELRGFAPVARADYAVLMERAPA